MKNGFIIIAVILFLVVPGVSTGQTDAGGQMAQPGSVQSLFGKVLTDGFGLLDPGKFSMSHSYMMSYLSSGGKGNMIGLYMNTMNYAISDPLSLTVHLGYLHQPFISGRTENVSLNQAIVSAFELSYQPRKDFFLKIEYGSAPYQYSPYYWGRSRSNW